MDKEKGVSLGELFDILTQINKKLELLIENRRLAGLKGDFDETLPSFEGLENLVREIGPWECGNSRCIECPHGVSQQKKCLKYFTKKKRKIDILKGMPYSRSELEKKHRRELATLAGALQIDPFRLEDKTQEGLIDKILEVQKTVKVKKKKKNGKKKKKKNEEQKS